LMCPQFWRTQRPRPRKLPNDNGFRPVEWPFEDESPTVALIEKIKRAMRHTNPEQPILIKEGPKTLRDATDNFYAFSDTARQSHAPACRDGTPPPTFPTLPECYGWMRVKRDALPELDPPVCWKKVDEDFDWHWAIVYEFVPRASQDIVVGQAHLDFFHAIGFALEPYKPGNWHGGRLIDFNDLCSPFSEDWKRTAVYCREAEKWFWTRECVQGGTKGRDIRPKRSGLRRTRVDHHPPRALHVASFSETRQIRGFNHVKYQP